MEERKDPLSLWVGSWTPEEIVEREKRRGKPEEPARKDTEESDSR